MHNPFARKKDPSQPAPSEAVPADHAKVEGGSADPDETAAAMDDLSKRIGELEAERDRLLAERDEARAEHKRALADFQNYQRRAVSNEAQARELGVRSVVSGVMPVIDHFEMALSLDPSRSSAQQVISGVSMIKDELLGALAGHGVALIRPAPGEAFDPTRHEAVMEQPSSTVPPGCVVALMRSGYALQERVIRPAQVVVAKAEPGAAGVG
jgi:molecular chaperone GrpE